jgi:DNA-3-methyladenine glycosylase II
MHTHIHTEADLQAALAELLELDPRLGELLALAGPPPLRRREGGFPGLAAIVCSQQLSVASASAIWGRLAATFDPFEPKAILGAHAAKLKRCGLSRPKVAHFRSIARAVVEGDLDLPALAELPAEDAHAALVAVKGIGPWTADIYLLFCIGHADAFPAGDLALQEAARLAFKKRKRPTGKQLARMAEPWRPWRGVAARLLWSYYRAVKKRDVIVLPRTGQARRAVPVQPKA